MTLQSWIEGEDAETAVPLLADARQYALGLEAGRILKKIHSIPVPEGAGTGNRAMGPSWNGNWSSTGNAPSTMRVGRGL